MECTVYSVTCQIAHRRGDLGGSPADLRLIVQRETSNKASDQCGDLIGSRVQCEMTGVENVNLSVRYILPVALRLAEVEGEIILAPDHQQAWLLLAHPSLPF